MYIKEEFIYEKIIEKSRFIVYLNNCQNEEIFKEYLQTIKKKYYDASHVCSAYISNNIKRSNDDGEPSGTAGMPILNALIMNNLDNTCAIVIRYFGGIKLGSGGLIRAYGGTVNEAIKKAIIVEDIIYQKYELNIDYHLANKIDNFIYNKTIVLDKQYDEKVKYVFATNDNDILNKIKDYIKGEGIIHLGEEIIQKMI